MDRYMFGKKTCNSSQRIDRFVSAREHCVELRRRYRPYHLHHKQPHDIWHIKHMCQKKYTTHLDEAFGLEGSKTVEQDSLQTWPCVPRKKSYLSSADSVLDLPTYSYAAFPELVDWSNDNILVAALGRNYHRWSWRTQSLINQGYTLCDVLCCKFDPTGVLLILGTYFSTIEIHNNELSKLVGKGHCICLKQERDYCSITAVGWSPTGNSFVAGCSRGKVMSFSRDSQKISWNEAFDTAIFLVRVSPDARYVAVTSVNSSTVDILVWPSMKRYWKLHGENCIIKTLSWHPWRSAFLGIGSDAPQHQASMALHDVPTSKLTVAGVAHDGYVVDAMLFSNRTGELVISMSNSGEETAEVPLTQLVVMSGAETVVDRWGAMGVGLDRIRTMVFSPDGTKLATATVDEDLIIWNFLPEDRKKKIRLRNFSAIPAYIDEVSIGISLR